MCGITPRTTHTNKRAFLRAKIQLLCKRCPLPITTEDLNSVHTLSRLAELLFDDAVANRASACVTETTEAENLYIFHDAIYHQCQIVLNSLMVPLFCGTPSDRSADCDLQTRMKAAQTVLNHADASEKLLLPFLHGEEDISRLPPLLGYSVFVLGTVFLSVEVAQRNQSASELPTDTGSPRVSAVERIVRLLDTLASFWIVLKEPVSVHKLTVVCKTYACARLIQNVARCPSFGFEGVSFGIQRTA